MLRTNHKGIPAQMLSYRFYESRSGTSNKPISLKHDLLPIDANSFLRFFRILWSPKIYHLRQSRSVNFRTQFSIYREEPQCSCQL